ncbi:MAG: hypothetical protein MUF64_06215 [Polyangiaceae bacterium]|jgi:hypothetical protein|nr:hypothetical protein [Polyangiaceae bacterium]
MSKPTFINVYGAGNSILIAPMAGWGGGYRETGEHGKAKLDDPDLAALFNDLMDRSDIRLGAYQQGVPVPYAKTGYGKAAAMARRHGAPLLCAQLFREENGKLTLQLFGPVPGERGLAPAGAPENPVDLEEAIVRIQTLFAANS